MQFIRRVVPRFAQTLLHGPQVTRRLSTPAYAVLQQRLYSVKRRDFPYWSKVLQRDVRLRALPYDKKIDYITMNSTSADLIPSPRILIRGLDPATKFSEMETSRLLSGNVGLSGSIKRGFLYVDFQSQEAASDVIQKINNATEYPFVVEGGSSNIVVPAYAEYARDLKKQEPRASRVLFISGYRGTLAELRTMLEPFSEGHYTVSERTTGGRRHIWVDLGSEDCAKSALESCSQRVYSYGDGKDARFNVYYGKIIL